MGSYKRNLIRLFLNFYEDVRNKRKNRRKSRGNTHKTAHISLDMCQSTKFNIKGMLRHSTLTLWVGIKEI